MVAMVLWWVDAGGGDSFRAADAAGIESCKRESLGWQNLRNQKHSALKDGKLLDARVTQEIFINLEHGDLKKVDALVLHQPAARMRRERWPNISLPPLGRIS